MTGQESDDWRDALDAALRAGEQPLDALARILAQGQGAAKTPPADLTAAAGTRAGPWQLVRLLGMGGMGVTWQGHGPAGEVAAVKLTEVVTPGRRERFEAECQALLRLDHPRIVRYRGHGMTERSEGWLAMDLVVGQPLHEILDEVAGERPAGAIARALLAEAEAAEPLRSRPWQRRMLRVVLAVTEGVAAAHAQGIVHRDLKPANILLATDLEPVLIDFGLSRNLFRAMSLTRSGDMLGTLAYMAPEQLASDGEQVDARSDVYALGLLLYRLLVGRDLRDTPQSLLRARPRPFRLDRVAARQLPVPVQAVLYRCLERDPRHRYAHAGELADDLRAVLGSGRVQARRPNGFRRWLRGAAAVPILAVVAAVAAAVAVVLALPGKPCLLTVDAFTDLPGTVSIDGGPPQNSPADVALSPGPHLIKVWNDEFHGPLVHEVHIDPARHHYRETFLNVGSGKDPDQLWRPRAALRDAPGLSPTATTAFLFLDAGADCTQILLNDTPLLPVDRGWWRVPAGPCRLVARSKHGEEQQDVTLRPHEAQAVTLLCAGTDLAKVPGRYRRTIATLLSPLPDDIRLVDRGDGVVVFLNGTRDLERDPTMQAKCLLTPIVPQQDLRASLRVEFPKDGPSMRSVVFAFRANVNEKTHSRMSFHWRVDRGDWVSIPPSARGTIQQAGGTFAYPRQHWSLPIDITELLPPTSAGTLEEGATMSVETAPIVASDAEAFIGIVDPAQPEPPCFAVVADPDPQVSRLRK